MAVGGVYELIYRCVVLGEPVDVATLARATVLNSLPDEARSDPLTVARLDAERLGKRELLSAVDHLIGALATIG